MRWLRCCMIKLQDEDTDEVHYTSIVCDLLDQHSCQCTAYPQRHALVEDCVVLTYERVGEFHWFKELRLSNVGGRTPLSLVAPLSEWYSRHRTQAEISVRDKVVAQAEVDENDEQDMIAGLKRECGVNLSAFAEYSSARLAILRRPCWGRYA